MIDFLEKRRCRIMEAKVAELASKYGAGDVWLADFPEGRFPGEDDYPEFVADTRNMRMSEYCRFRTGLEDLIGSRIALYSIENDNKTMRTLLASSRKIYDAHA